MMGIWDDMQKELGAINMNAVSEDIEASAQENLQVLMAKLRDSLGHKEYDYMYNSLNTLQREFFKAGLYGGMSFGMSMMNEIMVKVLTNVEEARNDEAGS